MAPPSSVSSAETPAAPVSATAGPPPASAEAPVNPPQSSAAPVAAPASDSTERVSEFWRRFHFLVGGGISPFGTRTYIDAPVYERAAPTYGTPGGMFFLQPSGSVFLSENVDFRLGADLRYHSLGRSQTAGAPGSSISALALSPLMAEVAWTPHPAFGLGANVAFGYMGLMSSNADVGAPFSATLDFGDQGGFFFGLQTFLSFWNQSLRVGYQLDTMPGGYTLPTGPTDPRAASNFQPIHSIFFGADLPRLFGNFGGARWF